MTELKKYIVFFLFVFFFAELETHFFPHTLAMEDICLHEKRIRSQISGFYIH